MKRRKFLKQSSCLAMGILIHPTNSNTYALNKSNDDLIVGHGSHRYKVNVKWGNLDPLKTPVQDCHEMVQDSKGQNCFTYKSYKK